MSTILQKYFRPGAGGVTAAARGERRERRANDARNIFRAKTKLRFSPG
jgi:hypothetical protein